jgi:hypothetical protein
MPDPSLIERLEALERRIAVLEAQPTALPEEHVSARPTAEPPPQHLAAADHHQPVAQPTRVRHTGHAQTTRQPGRKVDLEKLLGLSVLGPVGVVAVILAAAYFGQLGWARLGPIGRVTSLYLLAFGLLLWGMLLRTRVATRYVAMLWGGGGALAYLAGVFAHLQFALVGPVTAAGLLLATTTAGQWMAHALGVQTLGVLMLAGAYASPLLVDATPGQPAPWFLLAAVLHAWSALAEHGRGWRLTRLTGVLGSIVLAAVWFADHRIDAWADIVWVEGLLAVIIAPELLQSFRSRPVAAGRSHALLTLVSVSQALLFGACGENVDFMIFPLAAAVGWQALGTLLIRRQPRPAQGLIRFGSIALPVGALVFVHHEFATTMAENVAQSTRMATLTVCAVVQLGVRRWTRVGEVGVAAASLMAALMTLVVYEQHSSSAWQVALAAAPALLLTGLGRSRFPPAVAVALAYTTILRGLSMLGDGTEQSAMWTSLALSSAAAVALGGELVAVRQRNRLLEAVSITLIVGTAIGWLVTHLSASSATDADTLTPLLNWRFGAVIVLAILAAVGRSLLPAIDHRARTLLAATVLMLAYCSALLELLDAVSPYGVGWSRISMSLYTLAFAGGLLQQGFARGISALRWVGLCGFVFVVGKVLIHDLTGLSIELRALATGAVGLVLLCGAWAYARRRAAGDTAETE